MVYHAGEVPSSEAVVYIHHRHPARTGIEHREKRCKAAEGRAIAYACGNSYHRTVRKAAQDARQGAFHPGNRNDDAGAHDLIKMAERTMEPCDTHIIQPCHLIPHHLGSEGGFRRDRDIARAAGGNDNGADPVRGSLANGLRHLGRVGAGACIILIRFQSIIVFYRILHNIFQILI